MQKEMYNYQRIQEQILTEKKEAQRLKMLKEKELREQRQKQYMQANQNEDEESKGTGDPFKDFASEIEKVVSNEARDYINKGRESCYEFIDLLYRTDWKFYGKYQNVKVY